MIKNIQITKESIKEDIKIQEDLLDIVRENELKLIASILEGRISSLKKILDTYCIE